MKKKKQKTLLQLPNVSYLFREPLFLPLPPHRSSSPRTLTPKHQLLPRAPLVSRTPVSPPPHRSSSLLLLSTPHHLRHPHRWIWIDPPGSLLLFKPPSALELLPPQHRPDPPDPTASHPFSAVGPSAGSTFPELHRSVPWPASVSALCLDRCCLCASSRRSPSFCPHAICPVHDSLPCDTVAEDHVQ